MASASSANVNVRAPLASAVTSAMFARANRVLTVSSSARSSSSASQASSPGPSEMAAIASSGRPASVSGSTAFVFSHVLGPAGVERLQRLAVGLAGDQLRLVVLGHRLDGRDVLGEVHAHVLAVVERERRGIAQLVAAELAGLILELADGAGGGERLVAEHGIVRAHLGGAADAEPALQRHQRQHGRERGDQLHLIVIRILILLGEPSAA
jgi:hypothetical protein